MCSALRLPGLTMNVLSPLNSRLQEVVPTGGAALSVESAAVLEPGALPESAATSLWQVLSWPDQVGLAVLGTFLVLGALRGLWWQVIRLAGLLFAGILARALAPRFTEGLASTTGLPLVVSQGLLWFTIFVLGLVAASLLGTLGKKSLEMMQLGLVDRFGGALAGLLTGVALQAALLVLLSYLGPQPWTADALRGTRSEALLRLVSGRLPVFVDRHSVAAQEIRAWIGSEGDVYAAPSAATDPDVEPEHEGQLEPESPTDPSDDPGQPSRVR